MEQQKEIENQKDMMRRQQELMRQQEEQIQQMRAEIEGRARGAFCFMLQVFDSSASVCHIFSPCTCLWRHVS